MADPFMARRGEAPAAEASSANSQREIIIDKRIPKRPANVRKLFKKLCPLSPLACV